MFAQMLWIVYESNIIYTAKYGHVFVIEIYNTIKMVISWEKREYEIVVSQPHLLIGLGNFHPGARVNLSSPKQSGRYLIRRRHLQMHYHERKV